MRVHGPLVVVAIAAVMVAAATAHGKALESLEQTWFPFVLVTGLLLIGVVANEDGLFRSLGRGLSHVPGPGWIAYVVAMLVTAAVTVFLNLDTAVAFLTPVLIHLARHRRLNELRFLYGVVFMSNAASLLLPGSNLTNLLVLSQEHLNGLWFLRQTLWPWIAAVAVTGLFVGVWFRSKQASVMADDDSLAELARPGLLGIIATAIAIPCILFLPDPALPVLGVGVTATAVRLLQRRLVLRDVIVSVDFALLLGIFLIAVALGTIARSWDGPAHMMAGANAPVSAVTGALASVCVNNLPAAVLLGSHAIAHPAALLIGLNVGPNLAVTGSLSALIWWRSARSVGARPSVAEYSKVGLLLVPLTLTVALLALSVPQL